MPILLASTRPVLNSYRAWIASSPTVSARRERAQRMILTFPEVITAEEQHAMLAHVVAGEFVDGRQTAGVALADHKHNQQIRRDGAQLEHITGMLLQALRRNERFLSAVYPKQLHSLLVSR